MDPKKPYIVKNRQVETEIEDLVGQLGKFKRLDLFDIKRKVKKLNNRKIR